LIRLLGRLLRGIHAGDRKLAWNDATLAAAPATLQLTSPAFPPGGLIPLRHAGEGVGDNVSPELAWEHVPPGTAELVLIIEDPDAPLPRPFVHGIVTAIPPASTRMEEGALGELVGGPALGRNSFGRTGYVGPRALPGHGPHRYVFQLLALDRALSFDRAPSRAELLCALAGAVIARGRLDGTFEQR
jgi:Raf kinase inhibitor-like YbhB/YbcL family protein